ncbi:MAG: mono/diheme cytochrome c family protein [Litorivivens sp.]|jgi:mono/diheme cytochrome c family protein
MNKRRTNLFIVAAASMMLASCTVDENSPGIEFMPDMYRSPAVEAYVDYGMDPYNFSDSLAVSQRNHLSARKPVAGTIPYGSQDNLMYALPYSYPNTTEGYEAAAVNRSPLMHTQENVDKGEEIYSHMCIHCHGEKGGGDGKISTNGFILGIPAYDGKLAELPEGKMYHTLTFGKGLMGSHASQLTSRERWEVVEYVKVLQNGGKMLEISETVTQMEAVAEVVEEVLQEVHTPAAH